MAIVGAEGVAGCGSASAIGDNSDCISRAGNKSIEGSVRVGQLSLPSPVSWVVDSKRPVIRLVNGLSLRLRLAAVKSFLCSRRHTESKLWRPLLFGSFDWTPSFREWRAVAARACVVAYMSAIFVVVMSNCDPWYEFFYYLTLQGWTLELIYFATSLYLELLTRISARGPCSVEGKKRLPSHKPESPRCAEVCGADPGGAHQCNLRNFPIPSSTLRRRAPQHLLSQGVQILSEVTFAVQVVIVVFFWFIVFPNEPWRSVAWELNCHGAGLLLTVLDHLYFRYPSFSLRHNRYIAAFAATYTLTYLYVALYLNKPIYPGIDMKSLHSITVFLAGLSTVILTHKLAYLYANWRRVRLEDKTVLGLCNIVFVRQDSTGILQSAGGNSARCSQSPATGAALPKNASGSVSGTAQSTTAPATTATTATTAARAATTPLQNGLRPEAAKAYESTVERTTRDKTALSVAAAAAVAVARSRSIDSSTSEKSTQADTVMERRTAGSSDNVGGRSGDEGDDDAVTRSGGSQDAPDDSDSPGSSGSAALLSPDIN